jgi:hypothetical protein
MAILFYQGDGLSKEVWVNGNENPNYGEEAVNYFHEKTNTNKILAVKLEGLFLTTMNKVACSFFLQDLDLAFGGFTL